MPFIVRVETGYMDRDQYQITVLYQPGKPWSAVAPQPQFDHKLLILHGSSCGVDHETGTAPGTTGDSAGDYALGKGFMTMSTALDNAGHNCDLALEAESLVMAKEHIGKSYGTVRYTIGTGCSGGSLAQQWIANAYPGVYQGLLPTCSFPTRGAPRRSSWTTTFCSRTSRTLRSRGSGLPGSRPRWGTSSGGPDGVQNAKVSDNAQFHVAVPTDPCAGTTDADRYNPQTNPGGVRCTIQDAAINVFGPEPKALWSANEKKLGQGFVRPPIDNVGVEYGLDALKTGQITPADFVDLNANVGGARHRHQPDRARPTRCLAVAGQGLPQRDDQRGQQPQPDRDHRLPRPQPGTVPRRISRVRRPRPPRPRARHPRQPADLGGPRPIMADKDCELNSFIAMDRWLTAVERDHGSTSLPQKVIRDKPSDLSDECWDGNGHKLSNSLCPAGVVNVEGTPRTVAGDAITTDANKCQLKPLRRSDYPGHHVH